MNLNQTNYEDVNEKEEAIPFLTFDVNTKSTLLLTY